MNGKSQRGSHLEMKWRFIVPAGQPKPQCPQVLMTWVSIASLHSRLSN
jgi:hypothetical protein